jgi:predicted TIM-barrel fold metal-dependent hydrolase
MRTNTHIFDADGHIFEAQSEIAEFLPAPWHGQMGGGLLSGGGDGWNRRSLSVRADALRSKEPGWIGEHTEGPPNAARWIELLDEAGIDGTVLYPTAFLSVCKEKDPEWAIALATAYNSWMADKYLKHSRRLNAMAILPLHDIDESVKELKRAVTQLGFVGVVISANQNPPLGNHRYDPIYEAAQALDTVVAIHAGGPTNRFDMLDKAIEARCLGHPTSQMPQMTDMMFSGVFDRYPKLRFSFMEAGVAWIMFLRDRMHEAYEQWSVEVPELKREPSEHLTSGQIYFHCEVDELMLPYAVSELGDRTLLYACDFPHLRPKRVFHDLDEFRERTDLPEESKQRILGENARRLYKIDEAVLTA